MGIALHLLHVTTVVVAAAVLLVMLLPTVGATAQHRRADDLRRAVARGELIDRARADVLRSQRSAETSSAARTVVVVACLAAAAVHAIVCPEHFAEGVRFGVFFLVLTLAQVVVAVSVARSSGRGWIGAAVVLDAGAIAIWVVTRTVGLPWGLAEVEPVGVADVLATAAEVVAVVIGARALATVRAPRDASFTPRAFAR